MVEQVEDKLDHYPLKVKLKTRLGYDAEVARVRWDYEKLRKAVREGTEEAKELNRIMSEVVWEEGPGEEPMRRGHGRERELAKGKATRIYVNLEEKIYGAAVGIFGLRTNSDRKEKNEERMEVA